MTKAAILGATGPTGIHLARALSERGMAVCAVSRNPAHLDRRFPEETIAKRAADVMDAGALSRAIEGCDLVFDCLGLPAEQMHLHPLAARNIAEALRATGARAVQVSSYWAYLPLERNPLNEDHPRSGGPPWVEFRREAEDVLLDVGAAVLHLPDFYGSYVHTSTLQNALVEASHGRTVNWIGRGDVAHEYIYVPDAMRIAATVAGHERAFGARWLLPGSGPITGHEIAAIAGRLLGRPVRLREAGPLMLRLASLVSRDLRGLMQIVPEYLKPISFDAGKLEGLLGRQSMMSYEDGIAATLDWLAADRKAA
jgi:nucleoside-diphosphate-sugar epimerase